MTKLDELTTMGQTGVEVWQGSIPDMRRQGIYLKDPRGKAEKTTALVECHDLARVCVRVHQMQLMEYGSPCIGQGRGHATSSTLPSLAVGAEEVQQGLDVQ